MSDDTLTPSTARLRQMAASIAQDVAHAPVRSGSAQAVQQVSAQLQGIDRTMASTSEILSSALSLSRARQPLPPADTVVRGILAKMDACLSVVDGYSDDVKEEGGKKNDEASNELKGSDDDAQSNAGLEQAVQGIKKNKKIKKMKKKDLQQQQQKVEVKEEQVVVSHHEDQFSYELDDGQSTSEIAVVSFADAHP